MVTKAQKVRVVVFISIVSIIFLYIIFLLVGQKLFSREDLYFVKLRQQSAEGLNIGQEVKYYGINIGKITDIAINPKNISEIILTISIKRDTPIKNTVRANINMAGITGLKIVELTGGENSDPDLKVGSYIEADRGVLDNITGKAEVITEKIEQVLNNILELSDQKNRNHFHNIIQNADNSSKQLDMILVQLNKMVNDNQTSVTQLVSNTDKLILSLDETAQAIKILANNSNKIINSKESANILKNLNELSNKLNSKEIDNIINNSNQLVERVSLLTNHLDKTFMSNRKNIVRSIELFKEALDNFNEFMVLLRENPDIILKGKE